MPRPPSDLSTLDTLITLVKDLRGPEGCPWDKEQTHQSLAAFTLEEAYELAEILDQMEKTTTPLEFSLKDELADLLFQVVLHAELAHERKVFTLKDVITHLNEKLIRRHPHVFADVKVKDIAEVWKNWESIKIEEKKNKQVPPKTKSIFNIPQALPALQRAHKIGLKTEKQKFDWNHPDEVRAKVMEEIQELQTANTLAAQEEEMGDLLFSVAQWARHLQLDPEQCLRKANQKFEKRFALMMELCAQQKKNWDLLSHQEKETLWQEAKSISGISQKSSNL